MMMTKLMNVSFGGVGEGDGDCNGSGDGNSDSGGNTIRSAKQDYNYGASNIILPCPGS